jgi:glucan phosphoethanolaminetransferase (alkaline phosphatase superfamily)
MTAEKKSFLLPASAERPTSRQKVFLRYFTGILIDLTVLNLFVEYSENVVIDSFTISLLAAVVLQVLLKATIALEHRAASYFKAKPGAFAKFMRFFTAWLILFGSKFVILEALAFAFGDDVYFGGPFHGIVVLIVVVIVMLVAEEAIVQVYRRLSDDPETAKE